MATPETVVTPVVQARVSEGQFGKSDRLFYVVTAVLMLIFTAGGFRRFYLQGKAPWGELTSQITTLIVVHGLAMSSWVILFLVQSTLILTGYRRVHMVVTGRIGGCWLRSLSCWGRLRRPSQCTSGPKFMGL